jgi:hypothetical protein
MKKLVLLLLMTSSTAYGQSAAYLRCGGDVQCQQTIKKQKLYEDTHAKEIKAREQQEWIKQNTRTYTHVQTLHRNGKTIQIICKTEIIGTYSSTDCR